MRALLGLDPWIPRRQIWFSPSWPDRYGPLKIHHLPVGAGRVTLQVGPEGAGIVGLPPGIELVHTPRGPFADVRPDRGL
jgi:hypothetical protein